MHRTVMRRALLGAMSAVLVSTALAMAPVADADNVTVSGDVARTGWDAGEAALAPSQVTASDFGQQFAVRLDGSIYAQPLVIGNTVVVTTEKAKVYGISAATGAVLWQRSFGSPFQSSTIGCGDLTPDLGSTSTPVYDAATNTVYLTTKLADGPDPQHPHWYLQAINPADGSEKAGFPISLQGTADNDPTVTFSPYLQMQRAGLLYANGMVYLGFGSHCDIGAWRGWVMAVKVTGPPAMQSLFVTEAANGGGAGVWGAGGGLVTDGNDANGNPRVFFATGNGLSPANGAGPTPSQYLGDSVVRIGLNAIGHLAAHDFFAPTDAPTLDQNDTDLGSGGPVALPDAFGTTSHPHLLVEDGKDGRLFLLDRDNLGGRGQGAGGTDASVQTVGPYKGIWGHPAVYGAEGGWVYYVENGGPLRAYKRSVTASGDPALTAAGASSGTFGYTSGSPVVTSDGSTAGSGLVWVVYSSGSTGSGGQLRAYDAVPTSGVLKLRWSAAIGNASKFEMPTSSGGRIFVGSRDGVLFAFGRPATVGLTGSTVDAGPVAVGSSAPSTAHLTASRTITVTAASATAPFAASAAGLPKTLAPGDAIDVPVTFAPTAPGTASSTLTLATSLGPVTLDLHGIGTQTGLQASPSPLVFGTIATSQTKTLALSITNTGTTSEAVTSTSLPPAPFSVSGVPPAGTVIGAQQSIALSVTYAPVAAGDNAASLAITSTAGTLTVPLTGTGQSGQGQLAFNPASTDFGRVVVGTSRTLSFDIENTGNVPITVTKAKAPSGVFTAASPLSEGITIGPEDTVHQQVTFTPTVLGPVSATYLVSSDDGTGAQLETLTGTGVPGKALAAPTAAGWTRNGAAAVSGTDLVLTPARTYAAGSAFSNTTVPSDGLDAHFTAQLSGGTGADGMTFTLLDGTAPATSLGANGGGLGYGGLTKAVAVTLDTYQNGHDPSANFVGVAAGTLGSNDNLNYTATATNVGALTSGTHDVDVNVYGGHLRVTVDGDLKINLPVNLPATVRPGFTAATGGLTDRHAVRNVTITTPVPANDTDSTPPAVTLTSPTSNQTLVGDVTLTATATDNVAVGSVQFLVDGLPVGNPVTAAPYRIDIDSATLNNGAHTVSAKAIDTSNNATTATAVSVSVNNPPPDITPPTIVLTAPVTGSTVTGSVLVSASASDNKAVTKVQFYLDGNPLGAPVTSAPYQVTWNTAAANGGHTLSAAAYDAAGNVGTSGSVGVTVADTVPNPVVATRINDSDPSIIYSTGWTASPNRHYGDYLDDVHYALANGKSESLTFNGIGVKVFGEQYTDQGDIAVTVDGGPTTTVSTVPADGTRHANAVVFSAGGLANGRHTIVVRKASGEHTTVDGFEIDSVPASTGDLALYQPVTASSIEAGTAFAPSGAVDGSATTRWSSAYSDPQWIQVDLGSTRVVNEVRLSWEAAYAASFQVQVSTDAATWTTIYSTTTGTVGVNDLTGLHGTGRYLRVYGTKRGTSYGYSLWALDVYGS
jgi:hypothetical protein